MAELLLRKLYSSFVPVDQDAADAMEKIKPNAEVRCTIVTPRNLAFHRKFFGLLDVAYDAWECPELEHKGAKVQKNKERFRKDVIILCGHYEAVVNFKQEVRCEAKSISFAKMTQEEFEALYSTAIDVILAKILTHYTRDDLQRVVNEVLGFA